MATLTSLLTLLLIILIGFIVGKKSVLPENFPKLINKFLFLVVMPIFFFGSFDEFERSEVVNFLPFIIINILICAVLYTLLYNFLIRTKIDRKPMAAVITPSFVGNTFYFGFPILLTLFSPEHANYAIIYVVFVTIVDFFGMFLVSKVMGKEFQLKDQLIEFAKTPLLIATILGLTFMLLEIPLPKIILEVSSSFGETVLPLVMFAFGVYFSQHFKINNLRLALLVSFNKLLILPLVTYIVVYYVFPLPAVAAQTSVILACMPSAFYNLVIADNYELDVDVTLSSLIFTSLLFFLTSLFWINLVQ